MFEKLGSTTVGVNRLGVLFFSGICLFYAYILGTSLLSYVFYSKRSITCRSNTLEKLVTFRFMTRKEDPLLCCI
jgi:hypothetical protein